MGYALTAEQSYFVDLLRSRLSMRTQLASGSSMRVPGQLGNDELWEDFRMGLNYFNMFPPVITTYTSTDLYGGSANPTSEDNESVLSSAVMMCAEFFVGIRLQWFESALHFEFNDNGISLMRKKQADYAAVNSGILQFINATLPVLKKSIAFSRIHVKGQFSGQVSFPRSITRGLRGTRLGMGG
jgi:hypothetical protein